MGHNAIVLAAPTSVSRYQLGPCIGQGGMGAVYQAYDPQLQREVAVKLIREGDGLPTLRDERARRLLREARAIAGISHPNVIDVYDVGMVRDPVARSQGDVFMVMELVHGETLDRWASTRRTRRIVPVLADAARGLAAAHRHGCLHRDFKAANVMVDDDGRVRVLDFGLARAFDTSEPPPASSAPVDSARPLSPAKDSPNDSAAVTLGDELGSSVGGAEVQGGTMTRRGMLVGTPSHMAPELLVGGQANVRTDVYAFATAAYVVLYGCKPFDGKNVAELYRAKRDTTPSFEVRATNRTNPPRALQEVLRRSLAADPSDRPASMEVVIDVLQRSIASNAAVPIAGVAVLGLGLAGFVGSAAGTSPGTPSPCASPQKHFESRWGSTARGRLSAALGQAGLDGPRVAVVQDAVDSYGERWVGSYAEACAGDQRPGPIQCLDRDLVQFDSTLALLSSDPKAAARAVDVVSGLGEPERCLQQRGDEQSDPTIARLLALSQAYTRAGLYEEALSHGRDALRRAEQSRDRWQLAPAYLALAHASAPTSIDRARGYAEASYFSAREVGNESVAAKAAIFMAHQLGSVQGHNLEAQIWIEHARSTLARMTGHRALRAWLTIEESDLVASRGDAQRALEMIEAVGARASVAQETEEPPELVVELERRRSTYLSMLRRYGEALDSARAAVEFADRVYGPRHPESTGSRHQLAYVLLHGEPDESVGAQLDQIVADLEGSAGPSSVPVARMLINRATYFNRVGRSAAALDDLDRAETILVGAGTEAGDPLRLACGVNRVMVLVDSGQADAALQVGRSLLSDVPAGRDGPPPALYATLVRNLARAELQEGRGADAIVRLEQLVSEGWVEHLSENTARQIAAELEQAKADAAR